MRRSSVAGLLTACFWLGACASAPQGTLVDSQAEEAEPPLLGVTTQAELLRWSPDWVDHLVRSEPDEREARRLAAPAAGKEVVVLLGSWCSDSRRELTRLWRAVEIAGGDFGFPVRYVGVDRAKTEPAALIEGANLLYVPTLIVFEDGAEVGRIVESAPNGIETDLADLIEGVASGWLSAREDLEAMQASDRWR